ncbi:uncharacterized protein C8Q71DRAFT_739665 [Rhodofomes roseus]|uniref:Uncharacterized protein n=1 Tax=Rhodofomes roseus TaxID=34475 RepID=A0ABQ8KTB6_9APHY|nr:uncharacterized protein C8Q71DRAFT_739665 [Rhodofomes roseus]KAH9841952.1 hypothetical protein C8Q71DRAFT_739665 [Rhodofomes roseus]
MKSRVSGPAYPEQADYARPIVLTGTTSIFYKIPVAADLVRHVRRGTYPSIMTVLSAHVPVVPKPLRRYSVGMKPLDTRQAIIRCYEAFRSVVGTISSTHSS